MNHDAARARAAAEAFPDTGKSTWEPTVRPVPVTVVKADRRVWTVEQCAAMLGVEPFPVEEWRDHAMCKGLPATPFFPEKGDRVTPIVQMCVACPVRAECLTYALNEVEAFGVWGGVAENQRRNIRNGRGFTIETVDGPRLMRPAFQSTRMKPTVAKCGSPGGYDRHKRVGEHPCEACRIAHSRQANEYRKAKKRRERTQ